MGHTDHIRDRLEAICLAVNRHDLQRYIKGIVEKGLMNDINNKMDLIVFIKNILFNKC
jgi:hypothetical protein